MKIILMSFFITLSANAQFKRMVQKHVTGESKEVLCTQKVYVKQRKGQFSPLGIAVQRGIRPYLKKGTVSKGLVSSRGNYISRKVYNTGTEIFRKVAHIISQAKKEVLIQTFLVEFGSQAMRNIEMAILKLQARLKKENAKNPVDVKLVFNEPVGLAGLINPFGGQITKQVGYNKLRRIAFKKDDYSDLMKMEGVDPKYVRLEIRLFTHKLMGVTHSKSVVVDRSRAVVMGANMLKGHDRGTLQENDWGYLLMGKVALGLADDFFYGWGEAKPYAANYDPSKSKGTGFNLVDFRLPKVVDEWATGRILEKNVPMIIASRKERDSFIIRRGNNPVNKTILALMNNAKYQINIITPSLNSKYIVRALIKAIERGVDVNILLARQYQDSLAKLPFQGGTNYENGKKIYKAWKRALKENNRTGNFRLNWFVDFRGRLSREGDKRNPNTFTSHTKYLGVDNQVTMIGSSNLDSQSWYYSREINVVIDDNRTTSKWCKRVFRSDFLRGKPFVLGEK